MIIRDKQDLRRCVKQAVRRAEVVETCLNFDVLGGEMGVNRLMKAWEAPEQLNHTGVRGTPLMSGAVAAYAALDALELPAHDPDKAQAIQMGYDRETYLAQVLRAMRARRVLVSTPLDQAQNAAFADDRFSPLLVVGADVFAPGRYGADYRAAAQRIAQAARACGAMAVTIEAWDEQAIRYCLAPLCEDECLVFHVKLRAAGQAACLAAMMDDHPNLRVLASASASVERELISASAHRMNLLICLNEPAHLRGALGMLGARLLVFSSQALLPEQMLGRWVRAKEEIWPELVDAYLPLARAGYELTAEAIESDVQRLMGGSYLELHTIAQSE